MIKKVVCPICKKETYWKGNSNRPFCSERCKLIDLGLWIGGEYTIPGSHLETSSSSDDNQPAETGSDNSDNPSAS